MNIAPITLKNLPEGSGFFSVGIHPWDTAGLSERALYHMVDDVEAVVGHNDVVAIGEVGFDRLYGGDVGLQMKMVEAQLAISEQYQLPVIFHNVRSTDLFLRVRKYWRSRVTQPWILHGFNGRAVTAHQLLWMAKENAPIYISFGEHFSPLTPAAIHTDQILVETDESSVGISSVINAVAYARLMSPRRLRQCLAVNMANAFSLRDVSVKDFVDGKLDVENNDALTADADADDAAGSNEAAAF